MNEVGSTILKPFFGFNPLHLLIILLCRVKFKRLPLKDSLLLGGILGNDKNYLCSAK